MAEWMEKVYHRHITNMGQVPSSTILFMDNCASHVTPECISVAERLHLPWHTLPPRMTPLLQPVDQFIHSTLKREYARSWALWWESLRGQEKTRWGNNRRATTDEVNGWIATALQVTDAALIRASWVETMDAKPAMLRLPMRPWSLIRSYIPQRLASLFQAEGTIGKARATATAQNYVFPQKRRAAAYVPYVPPFGRPEAEDVLRPIRPPHPPGSPFAALPALAVASPLRLHPAFSVISMPPVQAVIPLPATIPLPLSPPPPASPPRAPTPPPVQLPPASPILPAPPLPAPPAVISHNHGTRHARSMRASAMR